MTTHDSIEPPRQVWHFFLLVLVSFAIIGFAVAELRWQARRRALLGLI